MDVTFDLETINGEDASADFKNLILYQKHVHARGA